mgnify:CR=1 FL=1
MKKCVVLSGAGISADSGLQTFRDLGGLWEGVRVEDVCTPHAYAKNPERVLAFYNERRRQAAAAQPNAAHTALAELADYYDVRIITQNVDDLHERAGSRHVLHLHGELNKLRSCLDEEYVINWRGDQSVDMTDGNGYPMRPHIVWFGESVPSFGEAVALIRQADVVMVVGTSLKVYPAASLLNYVRPDAALFAVDPHPQAAWEHMEVVRSRAAEGVPSLVNYLIEMAAAA